MSQPGTETRLSLGQKLRYGAEASAFFLLMGFFKILGLDAASAVGGFLGRNIFYHTSVSRRARRNLRAAFPEKTDAEIEAILIEMWDNLGRTTAEYPHLDKLSIKGSDPRIVITGTDISETAIASGKGVMFASGHFANWEIMPAVATQLGYEGALVYRPQNNPYVDNWVVRQRGKEGPKEHIGKGASGTKRIFTLLRKAKSIFLLVDQKTNEGIPVPFFGRDAMTTPLPAALALKLGAILLPTSNERMGGARFRVRIRNPIQFNSTGDHDEDVRLLTAKITEVIEEIVRERPSQWLWIHRRWPTPRDVVSGKR
jgi:KDO2-lipid IV(A) lauroyltransferase